MQIEGATDVYLTIDQCLRVYRAVQTADPPILYQHMWTINVLFVWPREGRVIRYHWKEDHPTLRTVYNESGYIISLDEREVYTAGNHALDSDWTVPPDSVFALPLCTIYDMAVETVQQIARERGCTFQRPEYVE